MTKACFGARCNLGSANLPFKYIKYIFILYRDICLYHTYIDTIVNILMINVRINTITNAPYNHCRIQNDVDNIDHCQNL